MDRVSTVEWCGGDFGQAKIPDLPLSTHFFSIFDWNIGNGLEMVHKYNGLLTTLTSSTEPYPRQSSLSVSCGQDDGSRKGQ